MRPWTLLAAAAAAIVLGGGAIWVDSRFIEPRQWIPDLAAGWALCAAGLLIAHRRGDVRVGPLLYLAGLAWFAPTIAPSLDASLGAGVSVWLTSVLFVLHRAPLAHAILTYPSGRASDRAEKLAVGLAYASVAVPVLWQSPALTVAASTAFAAAAYVSYRKSLGPVRRARRLAAQTAAGLCALVIGGLVARTLDSAGQGPALAILAYDLAVIAASMTLTVGVVRFEAKDPLVVDLVVDLGEERTGGLRAALAEALGDPSLEVGYWISERSSYVDGAGRRMELPASGSDRAITPIERDGAPIAALVHDPAVLADPSLLEAVSVAAQLGSSNARLNAEVQSRLAELRDSSRRLIESGDAERGRLEQRLHEGAQTRLERLAHDLGQVDGPGSPSAEGRQRLARAGDQLMSTLKDLRDLAEGLRPADLRSSGLAGALDALATRAPVPVRLSIQAPGLPPDLEAAIYFLCAEALTNVDKHADASSVSIDIVQTPTEVVVRVGDDGSGGADPGQGSGLRGLVDRVEALGGRLDLDSPDGGGTRLTARLPLGAVRAL